MARVYLATFGTITEGHKQFKNSLLRLKNEALSTNWFEDVFIYTEEDLKEYNRSLRGTGAGWWWWKPIVIQKSLEKVENNDIILFLDCGFSINKNGYERFYEYVDKCANGVGYLGFGGGPISSILGEGATDRHHTKRDLLIHLNCDHPKYIDTSQTNSGTLFVKKNKFGIDLINDWIKLSENINFLNDNPSINEEHSEFVSHKNDQSVLSLLVKLRLPELNDYLLDSRELSFNPKTNGYESYPFRADRLDDSMLWNRIPVKIINGKLVRDYTQL